MVRLWDPTTGAPVGNPLLAHTGSVRSVAFGTDGGGRPLLASGGDDRTVRLWDPATGNPVVTLRRRTTPEAVAIHNTHLAVADREGITVVEVMDGGS